MFGLISELYSWLCDLRLVTSQPCALAFIPFIQHGESAFRRVKNRMGSMFWAHRRCLRKVSRIRSFLQCSTIRSTHPHKMEDLTGFQERKGFRAKSCLFHFPEACDRQGPSPVRLCRANATEPRSTVRSPYVFVEQRYTPLDS